MTNNLLDLALRCEQAGGADRVAPIVAPIVGANCRWYNCTFIRWTGAASSQAGESPRIDEEDELA